MRLAAKFPLNPAVVPDIDLLPWPRRAFVVVVLPQPNRTSDGKEIHVVNLMRQQPYKLRVRAEVAADREHVVNLMRGV